MIDIKKTTSILEILEHLGYMISPSNACCTLQTQNKQEEKSYLLFVSYNMAKICILHTQVSIFHEAMYTIRQNFEAC